jgi:broad specificity phosphatase PhoE
MTITRLFLVRHGATAATEEDRFSGSVEAQLSDEGRRQAALLGERLSKWWDRTIPNSLSGASDDLRGSTR